MQALLDAIAAFPLPTDAGRILHGRGGLYPRCEQWALDAYLPVFVLTSHAPVSEEELAAIRAALQARRREIVPADQQNALTWVFQQHGLDLRLQARSDTRLMAGHVPDPHIVTDAGTRYRVQVLRRQNHGLFLDMVGRATGGCASSRRLSKKREGCGARVLRGLPSLLAPGDHALLCLNAPEWPMEFLRALVNEHAPRLTFVERVQSPTAFADVDEGRGVKMIVYRVTK